METMPVKIPQRKLHADAIKATINSVSKIKAMERHGMPFGWTVNGEVHNTTGPCYADLEDVKSIPQAVYIVLYGSRIPEAQRLRYISWLIGPRSPWREYLRKRKNKFWDPEFIHQHGLIMDDMSIPGNVLGNFLISARFMSEYPERMKLWGPLVEAGVNEAYAFWLSHMHYVTFRQVAESYINGHCGIDVVNAPEENLIQFVTGKIIKPSAPYKLNRRYRPCNVIFQGKNWNYYDAKEGYRLFPAAPQRLPGTPWVAPPKPYRMSIKDFTRVALLEQERLGFDPSN